MGEGWLVIIPGEDLLKWPELDKVIGSYLR